MAQNIGPSFGTGKSGYLTTSGTQDINTRTGASGTAGTRTMTVDSITGFSTGDLVLIHKSRGNTTTACGSWEFNRLSASPEGTTMYIDVPLSYNYQNSSNDQSQVILVPEYLGATISSGTYLQPAVWDGSTGGILVFFCNGTTNIVGTIRANGTNASIHTGGVGSGFSGGNGNVNGAYGYYAEGTAGASGYPSSAAANGNGGGGGAPAGVGVAKDGPGGGGGHGTAGTTGSGNGALWNGLGAPATGDETMATIIFGGGGGGGGSGQTNNDNGGGGGGGGGIIMIISKRLNLSGSITSNGGVGACSWACGGGGSGGSIFLRGQNVAIGSNLVVATGAGAIGDAGAGGTGRVYVQAGDLTGTTSSNPTYYQATGYMPWNGKVGIMG